MTASSDFHATLLAARAGDGSALNELLSRFYPAVSREVHKALASSTRRHRPWLNSLFSTGDVVQEVFVSVVRDLEHVQAVDAGGFVSYLTTLVRNRLIDTIRFHEALQRGVRNTQPIDDDELLVGSAASPVDRAASAEGIEQFCAILNATPARERALLMGRIERGETYAELQRSLGYPSEDAARKAFYTAQARLILSLRRAGIHLGGAP